MMVWTLFIWEIRGGSDRILCLVVIKMWIGADPDLDFYLVQDQVRVQNWPRRVLDIPRFPGFALALKKLSPSLSPNEKSWGQPRDSWGQILRSWGQMNKSKVEGTKIEMEVQEF